MKTLVVLTLSVTAVLSPLLRATPIEMMTSLDTLQLRGYTTPLAHALGAVAASGLYYSARTHRSPGFDIGVRFMSLTIPASDKFFKATVTACSASAGKFGGLDTFYISESTAATIFGKTGTDSLFELPAGAMAFPPVLPGGLGMTTMTMLVPQASVGLPLPGAELMVRYVPWPFQGATISLLGFALKEDVSTLLGASLPFNLAIQAWWQRITVGSMVNATSLGANVHVSKDMTLFTPYAGIGLDNTGADFRYDYKYDAPVYYDTTARVIVTYPVVQPVSYHIDTGANFRLTAGLSAKLGPAILSADYTLAHNPTLCLGLNAGLN